MPPTTLNTKLKSVIESLKLNVSKKKQSSEVADSLEQLNSIVKLLEISNPWPDSFQRLSSLLRQHLLPLYRASLALSLQYSVTVFTIIHEERIIPATKVHDDVTRSSWEIIQTSLLSGILDFLEEEPTHDNRAMVAVAIYPTLRTVCNTQATSPVVQLGSIILHTVYQLLSETVTAHPINQRKLRSPDHLGGKQIGVILSQTKDYLALEALLELFAKLLPSMKTTDGREKRTKFIGEVFNPSIITCSTEIVHILESISSSDWEHTSTKIIDALARANIAFPQPFEIAHFRMPGSKPYVVDRLYIDRAGFVANLDESGELETFQASYSIIKSIKVSAPSTLKTRITLLFISPPAVGQTAIKQSSDEEISVSFDMQSKDVTMFLKSLNNRGLRDIVAQSERKLSKAVAHLDLDFDGKGKEVPISTQEKVQNIQRLWNEVLPTSPLFVPGAHDPQLRSRTPPPRTVSSPVDTIPLKGLASPIRQTDKYQQPIEIRSTHSKIEVTTVDSEDESHAPVARRTRAANQIVISDDEVEEIPPIAPKTSKPSLSRKEKDPLKPDAQDATRAKLTLTDERKRSSGETNDEAEQPLPKRLRRETVHEEEIKLDRRRPAPKKYGKKGRTSSPAPLATHEIDFDELPAPSTDQPGQNNSDPNKPQGRISAMKRKGGKPPPRVKHVPAKEKAKQIAVVSEKTVTVKKGKGPAMPPKVAKKQEDSIAQIIEDNEKPSRRSARVANIKGRRPNNVKSAITTRVSAQVVTKTPDVCRPLRTDKEPPRESPLIAPLTTDHQPRPALQPTREIQKNSDSEGPDSHIPTVRHSSHKKPQTAPWREKEFVKSIVSSSDNPPSAGPSSDIPSSDDAPNRMSIDTRNPVEESDVLHPDVGLPLESPTRDTDFSKQEEYFESIRIGSTSLDISIPDNDVVMIDLTKDSPKPIPKLVPKVDNPHKNLPIATERLRPMKLPTPSPPTPIAPPPRPEPPRVAFVASRSYHDHVPSTRTKGEIPLPWKRKATPPMLFSPPFDRSKNIGRRHAHNPTFADKTDEYDDHSYRVRESDADPTSRIVDVIGEITQVIVQNASKRFDNVRKDLRAGQISILLETAHDLEKMRIEGIDHFNTLVDLEEEYASHRRRIIDGFEELAKASQDISHSLTETIQEHNRNSLSRKFSNTLFASSLPTVLLNPKLAI